jgi:hypothetical protein
MRFDRKKRSTRLKAKFISHPPLSLDHLVGITTDELATDMSQWSKTGQGARCQAGQREQFRLRHRNIFIHVRAWAGVRLTFFLSWP